jgi:REP element-mobilizing transposase RayT
VQPRRASAVLDVVPLRRPKDRPGGWFHLMNRGIARRTIIEGRADARTFLAAVARCVRSGWLEVHAYCLMTTHYHMLARSPAGRLADAMQRIQMAYSKSFNRRRRRDGPLVRGRYRSKQVESLAYRRVLVAYIDWNPVQARIVERPADYPFCSARHYARPSGPPWLERSWVESEVLAISRAAEYEPAAYDEAFVRRVPPELRSVVARRILSGSLDDSLGELLRAPPERVLDWMRRTAALADGTRPGLPICEPATIQRAIAEAKRGTGGARDRADRDSWRTMQAGLLRQLAGCRQVVIAARMRCSTSRAHDLIRGHRERLSVDPEYAARAASLANAVLNAWKAW